jgi:hypothetical protein
MAKVPALGMRLRHQAWKEAEHDRLRRALIRLVSAVRLRYGENAPEDCSRRRALSDEGHVGADGGEKIVRGAGADRVADMGVEAVS